LALNKARKLKNDDHLNWSAFSDICRGQYIDSEQNKVRSNCHTVIKSINLPDVTFKSMESNILAKNHIILCGMADNLSKFVIPLRSKHLTELMPIVILHTKPPTEKQWKFIAIFPEIYYVRGSGMSKIDLKKANIMWANNVVILSS